MEMEMNGVDKGLVPVGDNPQRGVFDVPLARLKPNPENPRTIGDEESLRGLAATVRKDGVLQNIVVQDDADGFFTVVAGARRVRAAEMAGLTVVPAVRVDPADACEVALLENMQREDLHPLDLAAIMGRLKEEKGYSLQQLSERVGKSVPTCCEIIRVLELPDAVKTAARDCPDISRRVLLRVAKLHDEPAMLAEIEAHKNGEDTNKRSEEHKAGGSTATGRGSSGLVGSVTSFCTKLEKAAAKRVGEADPGALRLELLRLRGIIEDTLQALDDSATAAA